MAVGQKPASNSLRLGILSSADREVAACLGESEHSPSLSPREMESPTGLHRDHTMSLSGLISTAARMSKSCTWWVVPLLVPRRPGAVECGSGRSRLVLHLIPMKTVSQGHEER